jgi:cytochrome c-type protein NapB
MRALARLILNLVMLALLATTLVAVAAMAAPPAGQPAPALAPAEPVNLQSLRGETPIDKTSDSDISKLNRDSPPLPRSSSVEPPLIPHSIRGYQITKNFNKCMDCHAWDKTRESGATRVSETHFKGYDGRKLDNISPRRYVCTTCHVPVGNAPPLVVNSFQPAPELVPKR